MHLNGCVGLTNITIPSSVVRLSVGVFGDWTSSQKINIQFKENEIPNGWASNWHERF